MDGPCPFFFEQKLSGDGGGKRDVDASPAARGSPVLFDHIRGLLADHDHRRVRVAADYGGHYGCVDHTQSVDAVHPEPRVDHRVRVAGRAHLARARRMVDSKRKVPERALPVRVTEQLVLLAPGHGREQRPGIVSAERGCVGHVERDPDALDEHAHVLRVGEIVGLDDGMRYRVGRPQPHPARAPRPQQQGQKRPRLGVRQRFVHRVVYGVPEPGDLADLIAIRIDRAGREVELHVRIVTRRVRVPGVDKCHALDAARRERTSLVDDVIERHGRGGEPGLFERDRFVDDERQAAQAHVVLQVVAHLQVGHHRLDTHVAQVFGRPDAGHHEQLRRPDGACREHDLLARHHHASPAAARVHHARGPRPVEQHARHLAVHGHVQVGPEPDGPQERLGRAAPAAPPCGRLRDHEPALVSAVDVAVLIAQLLAGGQERRGQWCPPRRLRHGQVAAARVVRGTRQIRVSVVLGLEEVRQHVRVRPARVAGRRPRVVVLPVAAHVHHGVQHA